MRALAITTLSLFLMTCGTKEKDQGVNFLVRDQADTVSHFYYQGHEKYSIHKDIDSLLIDPRSKSSIKGEFNFGIKDRLKGTNKFLMFRHVPNDEFRVSETPNIPFLNKEFNLTTDYDIILMENYIDSTERPLWKYETQLAVNRITKDTVIFQESNYVLANDELICNVITFDNYESREEMRQLMEDISKTLKQSIKK